MKLPHRRPYILKAHKPANWVSSFKESIKEAQQVCNYQINRERSIAPNFEGSVSGIAYEVLKCVFIVYVCTVISGFLVPIPHCTLRSLT